MSSLHRTAVRPLSVGMRRMLLLAAGLVFIVGISLLLLTERTDHYFAWTVNPPLTAAFLGAGYWASVCLEVLAARERVWVRARIAVPSVLAFTTLTLVVTLLNLDRFRFGRALLPTGAGTSFWLAVYAVVPPVLVVLLFRQLRVPGADPLRTTPLPRWLRVVLGAQAVALLTLGLALFVAPGSMAHFWPWRLTTLTAQAVAAWLLGLGVAAAQAHWENDVERDRVALRSYLVLGLLQLIGLARYPSTVDWYGPRAWLYVLFLLGMLLVGSYGWLAARQPTQLAGGWT